jgi:hypothetical protein
MNGTVVDVVVVLELVVVVARVLEAVVRRTCGAFDDATGSPPAEHPTATSETDAITPTARILLPIN